jgi:hypothetical protein
MNSSRPEDRDRPDMFINGVNIARFPSLLGHATSRAKRATILMSVAVEQKKPHRT